MALITLQELKDEAQTSRRQLSLTDYSDAILTKEINKAQAEIERKSGRVFTEKTFQQSELNRYSSMVFLKKSPVTEITKFQIGGSDVSESDYLLDPETGIIEFDWEYAREFSYEIEYKACENPDSDAYLEAQDICMDMVFMRLQKPSDEKDIKSFKDSNFSVTYEDTNPQDDIDKRIKSLEKPVMEVIEA